MVRDLGVDRDKTCDLLPPPRTPATLELTVRSPWADIKTTNFVYFVLAAALGYTQLFSEGFVMSEVDTALFSKVLACITLPSGAMTQLDKSSKAPPHFILMALRMSHPY